MHKPARRLLHQRDAQRSRERLGSVNRSRPHRVDGYFDTGKPSAPMGVSGTNKSAVYLGIARIVASSFAAGATCTGDPASSKGPIKSELKYAFCSTDCQARSLYSPGGIPRSVNAP